MGKNLGRLWGLPKVGNVCCEIVILHGDMDNLLDGSFLSSAILWKYAQKETVILKDRSDTSWQGLLLVWTLPFSRLLVKCRSRWCQRQRTGIWVERRPRKASKNFKFAPLSSAVCRRRAALYQRSEECGAVLEGVYCASVDSARQPSDTLRYRNSYPARCHDLPLSLS